MGENNNKHDKFLVSIRTLFKQQKDSQSNEPFLEGIHTLFTEKSGHNNGRNVNSKLIIPIIAVSTILALLVLLDVISITLAAITFSIALAVTLYNTFYPDQNLQDISVENQEFKALGKS